MQRLAEGEVQADLARSYGASQPSAGYRVIALSRPARPPPSEAVRASADHQLRCQREGARFSISVCLAQHQPASSEVNNSGAALAQKARWL